MGFGDGMMTKALEGIMGKLPGMDNLVQGYEFKDGSLKALVEYKRVDGDDIEINSGVVILRAFGDCQVGLKQMILSDISLLIIPPTMMFMPFLTHHQLTGTMTEVVLPGKQSRPSFIVESVLKYADTTTPIPIQIKKGDILGYGIFIPFAPLDNISLTKQNVT